MNEKPKTAPKPTEIDLPFRLNDEEDYAPYVPKSAFPGVQQQTSGQILKNAEEAKRGAVYDLFPDLTLGASKVSLHSPSSAAGKNDEKKIQTAREAYAAGRAARPPIKRERKIIPKSPQSRKLRPRLPMRPSIFLPKIENSCLKKKSRSVRNNNMSTFLRSYTRGNFSTRISYTSTATKCISSISMRRTNA